MNVIARPSLPRPQVSGLQGEVGPLAVYDWAMPTNQTLGTVILVHGLGEHAGRYGEVAAHLHQWGFAVRAYDCPLYTADASDEKLGVDPRGGRHH